MALKGEPNVRDMHVAGPELIAKYRKAVILVYRTQSSSVCNFMAWVQPHTNYLNVYSKLQYTIQTAAKQSTKMSEHYAVSVPRLLKVRDRLAACNKQGAAYVSMLRDGSSDRPSPSITIMATMTLV